MSITIMENFIVSAFLMLDFNSRISFSAVEMFVCDAKLEKKNKPNSKFLNQISNIIVYTQANVG